MEIIDFKAGPQIATSTSNTVVRDIYGGLWVVLKNITNATAQPKEGAYYTKYVPDYLTMINSLITKVAELTNEVIELKKRPQIAPDAYYFHPNDFYKEDFNGFKTIRKR